MVAITWYKNDCSTMKSYEIVLLSTGYWHDMHKIEKTSVKHGRSIELDGIHAVSKLALGQFFRDEYLLA